MSSGLPQPHSPRPTSQGTVIRKSQGSYLVRSGQQAVPCAVSSRLRKVLIYPTAAPTSLHHRVQAVADIRAVDPLAVGDEVEFAGAGEGAGLITGVLPRRNALVRPAAGPIAPRRYQSYLRMKVD